MTHNITDKEREKMFVFYLIINMNYSNSDGSTILDLHEAFSGGGMVDLRPPPKRQIDIIQVSEFGYEQRLTYVIVPFTMPEADLCDWPGLYYTLGKDNELIRISAVESLETALKRFVPDEREITLKYHIAYPGHREYGYKSARAAKQGIKRVAKENYDAGYGYTLVGPHTLRL